MTRGACRRQPAGASWGTTTFRPNHSRATSCWPPCVRTAAADGVPSAMSTTDLRTLRNVPFAILEQIEDRLAAARLDALGTGGQAQSWPGLGFRLGSPW